jgi:hypothetical protein
VPREEETVMPRTRTAVDTQSETQACARQRALAAVQEAMDRRDNGGDAATATDN